MRNAEVLAAIADPMFQTELGRFNIEINVAPRRLADGGFASFEESVRRALNAADDKAEAIGTHLAMVGILPTLMPEHVTLDSVSENPRYSLLDQQIFAARGEDLEIVIDGVERLADGLRHDHAGGGLHLHPGAPAGEPGRLRRLLERGAGGGRHPGRRGRELAVPVRSGAGRRVPDPAVRAEHRDPGRGAEDPGRPAAGLVRRTLDHLDLRPVRGELALLPGPAADQHRRGPDPGPRRRWGADAGRAAAAQRHGLPLEPSRLRHQRRQARTCGWRTGCCRPVRPWSTRWPTRPSSPGWCGPWPTTTGRSGARCRSRPRTRTSRRGSGTASTPTSTGRGSVR